MTIGDDKMEKRMYCMFVHDGGDGKGGLWCEFPDLPGCMTDGDNLEDLVKNAADALESWMEATIDHGETMPASSSIEELNEKAASCEEPVLLVVPVTGYLPDRPMRINVTSTEAKIAEITAFAKRVKRTRSELMVDATLEYIRANA